ncbi:MAG: HEPN domain-containing protein [Chloroflexota bacterium]
MSDPSNPLDWANYAEQDWETAKLLLKRAKPLTISVCFHAQQSAEKYLKALLVAKEVDFPKTHDLSSLNVLCDQAGILTGFSPARLTILTDHAVASRYPGNEPTIEDAKESIEIANSIRKFARSFLGLKK